MASSRWIWVSVLALVPFLGWWTYGLFDLDEGFYAAVTGEMIRRGEWITPYLNGEPWFEKPILLYWAAIPAIKLFGPEFGPRLPSVLATWGTGALLAWYASRRGSPCAGAIAWLVFCTSLLPIAIGRMMLTDSLLVLALTGCFLFFHESLVGSSRWRIAAAAALGVAVLAKGPVGGAFFLLVAGITYWRQPDLRPAFRGSWGLSILAFTLVVATWYLPAYLVNREVFVQKFLIEQNWERFIAGDEAHMVRGWVGYLFYVPILIVGMTPWIFAAPKAIRSLDSFDRYLVTWAGVVFVFFTISQTKLPHYILPMFPALALWLGRFLDRSWNGLPNRRLYVMAAWTACIAAFAQGGFMSYYYGANFKGVALVGFHAEVHALARWVRDNAGPNIEIAEYRMSRLDRDLGTGKPRIQETSHPSILFVLDRVVVDAKAFEEILAIPRETWILTRWNRITQDEVDATRRVGRILTRLDTPVQEDLYALWRVSPAPD